MCQSFWVARSFIPQRGTSQFSVEKLLFHSAEEFRRGTLLIFRKFLVPKNLRDKKGCKNHDYPLKMFCLSVRKHSAGVPFRVSLVSGFKSFSV